MSDTQRQDKECPTWPITGGHVYKDGAGELRLAVRWSDGSEIDRPLADVAEMVVRSDAASSSGTAPVQTEFAEFIGRLSDLAHTSSFWEEKPYGNRLYYGIGAGDYIAKDVLHAFLHALKNAAPQAPGNGRVVSSDGDSQPAAAAPSAPSATAPQLAAVLDEIEEFLEDRQDVRDGADGEMLPNKAMSLLMELQAARSAIGTSITQPKGD